ncbi:TetR/AcrR family transcriptional regulator [Kitasatospora nipponensis]|uniref:TetR/AcrR family transcriptional regulator n=1 Tax=Kitasatospora nipponensis TaxID=258049 RepID=A0ABN1WWI5_9ACTN
MLADRGFDGLTLRAVATAMGASTGLLTHYFPNKRELLRCALEVLGERAENRPRRTAPAAGLAALRTALLDILPLEADAAAANRIWVGSWDVALADPELAREHAARYRRARERLELHALAAQQHGELPPGSSAADLATAAQGFALGLVVQALFAPDEFPPERQIRLLDAWLAGVGREAGGSDGNGPDAGGLTSSSAAPGPAAAPPAGSG